MKKVELLAPAGSMEALYAAVQNGCDAVYLGGEMFGARAFAHNFSKEDLKEAIRYAHIYGVNVYVTVNTLIHETEMDRVIAYITYLQNIDVDALIVQDLGLLSILRTQFPDMEIHASTQMHVHNPQGIQFLKEKGVKRVVVPRETTIEEIQAYAKLGVDLEVFVQGALCVSYSGQCLMSSVLFDRSGNRGACAQPCRMQYGLYQKEEDGYHKVSSQGDYILSPKDLNTLKQLPALIDAGVASFKIEGRMKRPEYVAYMVALYRKAIDAHEKHQSFEVHEDMLEQMEKLFHRGFTDGHIFHAMGSALMNPIRPNHMGVEIGRIIKLTKDKMSIQLTKELSQGDGIRILHEAEDEGFRVNRIYQNGLLVNHGTSNTIIELDRIHGIKEGAIVLKTSDTHQLKQLQETYQGYQRRVAISASFVMVKGQPPILCVFDEDHHSVEIVGSCMVEQALKTPLDAERIHQQLRKSKDTPFDIVDIYDTIEEDAIMPIKEVNKMRREALDMLASQRAIHHENRRILPWKAEDIEVEKKEMSLHIVVHNKEQYQIACRSNAHLYIADRTLYEEIKQENPNVMYRIPRVMKQEEVKEPALSQELGSLKEGINHYYDTSLNVTNRFAAHFLFQHHAACVLPSLELDKDACIQLVHHYQTQFGQAEFGYVIYGKRELMISEYCPINATIKDSDKKNCGLCRQHEYMLIDKKKRKFPLLMDRECRMHLLEEQGYDRILDIKDIKKAGIHQFFCVFTNEKKDECAMILKRIQKELDI